MLVLRRGHDHRGDLGSGEELVDVFLFNDFAEPDVTGKGLADIVESSLEEAGAEVVDPVVIPDLNTLLAKRARSVEGDDEAFAHYVDGSANAPFATRVPAAAALPQTWRHCHCAVDGNLHPGRALACQA